MLKSLAQRRHQLLGDHPRVLVVERVVLGRPVGVPVAPVPRGGLGLVGPPAGVDEHADHDRDLAPVDQVVHHVLRPHVPLLVLERLPVLVDHQGRRDGRVVLRRHVDPVRVLGAGVDLAGERERPADLPLRDALLRQGVGPQPVLGIGVRACHRRRLPPRLRARRDRHDHVPETDNLDDRLSHRKPGIMLAHQDAPDQDRLFMLSFRIHARRTARKVVEHECETRRSGRTLASRVGPPRTARSWQPPRTRRRAGSRGRGARRRRPQPDGGRRTSRVGRPDRRGSGRLPGGRRLAP